MSDAADKQWRITTRLGGGFISWRPGYALPQSWHAAVEGEQLPYRLELDFTADELGPQCRAVRFVVVDEPMSAARIRKVRVGECIEAAITAAAMRAEQRPGELVVTLGGRRDEALTERGDVDVTERAQFASQVPARHEHGTDEHLRRVADIYLGASEKPTQAVETAFGPHVSRSTVGRWIAEARHRGFIPLATRGRRRGRR